MKCIEDEGMPKKGSPFEKGRLFIYFRIVFPPQGSLSPSAIKALKTALPAPTPPEPYDPEETEVVYTEMVDLQDFGKKDPTSGDAYDSDDGEDQGRGGVQCQQG